MKKHASSISLTLLILICFGIGYWTGLHPQILEQYINLTQREVLLYMDDDSLITPPIRELLINSSHVRIKYTDDNPELADICLMSLENFKKIETSLMPVSMTKKEIQLNNLSTSFRKRISPDFLIHELDSSRSLPVLWQYEKGERKIEIKVVFPRFKVNATTNQKIYDILSALLDSDFQNLWIASGNWSTTLQKMDESFLPEEKKAIFIRKLNLKDMIWK